ncbi:hypothetical protein RHMOL_Rhmol01G0359600 [Rhododendron molle]|uniref:Uncharacterized protein n=1 Tax=Rhododendron molle TaxID=49168 RepID=A0ACC0QAL7_RHOML|nr:hypothetical protein RHMOL_Rhmol01G0359600 [Rhododendron molle]
MPSFSEHSAISYRSINPIERSALSLSFCLSLSPPTPSGLNSVSKLKLWQVPYRKVDLEAGATPLYPTVLERPELRWSFIRKVYSILTFQLLLTVAVSAVVVEVRPIALFFATTPDGLALYILLLCTPFIWRVILKAAILTAGVAVGLTSYTFWAAKRGYDFNFLGPFLSAAIFVAILFCLLQIFLPLGKISVMVYGCIAAIVFCGYVIYDTDNLIKRYSYDEYIWASVALYLDIINLFLSLLTIFRAADR